MKNLQEGVPAFNHRTHMVLGNCGGTLVGEDRSGLVEGHAIRVKDVRRNGECRATDEV